MQLCLFIMSDKPYFVIIFSPYRFFLLQSSKSGVFLYLGTYLGVMEIFLETQLALEVRILLCKKY